MIGAEVDPDGDVILFQYGSNMSASRLQAKVTRYLRYTPAGARTEIHLLGRARLPGWHFILDLFATEQDTLVADICERSGQDQVWGVVYKLDRELVDRSDGKRSVLDRIEGHRPERNPENYRPCIVRAELDGALVSAVTYVGTNEARRRCREEHLGARVDPQYAAAVLEGAASADLPPDYQAFLRRELEDAARDRVVAVPAADAPPTMRSMPREADPSAVAPDAGQTVGSPPVLSVGLVRSRQTSPTKEEPWPDGKRDVPRGGMGQRRGKLTWPRRSLPRRVRIAAAGYAAVAVFGAGVAVARAVGASANTAVIVGALAAAPLVFALIGDRITGIKTPLVEISLSEVTVAIDGNFSGAVMKSAEIGLSAVGDLLTSIRPLMQERSKLLRINLRDDAYWWSTRLFLAAALADDYTDIEALIFVRSDEDQIFVGTATPRAVRAKLAVAFPKYEIAYRRARSKSAALKTDPEREVNEILTVLWAREMPSEYAITKTVSSGNLRELLGRDLDTESFPYGPLTPVLRYRIISRALGFSALTDGSRLVDVVDRNELAIRSANAELESRIDRSP
jgi:Gamma-glutamyl cyclotransferase, AIG2-like